MMSLFKGKQTYIMTLAVTDNPRQTDGATCSMKNQTTFAEIDPGEYTSTLRVLTVIVCVLSAKLNALNVNMVSLAHRLISVPSFISLCASTVLCKSLPLYRSILSFSQKWMISMYGVGCVWWCSNMMSPMCMCVWRWTCALVKLEYSVPHVHSGRHFCPDAVILVNPGPGDIKHSVCVLFCKSCLKNNLMLEHSRLLCFSLSTSLLSNSIFFFHSDLYVWFCNIYTFSTVF